MTVKDIIKLVCDFVGEGDIAQKLTLKQALSAAERRKVEQMTNCFNLVNQEIASDYLPLLKKETLKEETSMINFADLTETVVHILEIKNRFGISLKFRLFPNYAEISGRAKTVVYSFLPKELTQESEIEMLCGLSPRIYAYGVASEYLLIDGLTDDAEIWEERFKESLFMLSRKSGEHRLPRRKWL